MRVELSGISCDNLRDAIDRSTDVEHAVPFAFNRGQRIHYTIDGSGPLVILQHGLLLDAESWRRAGIVAALAGRYRIACIDSLGHGRSDKPSDAAFYGQEQRAGDIAAVLDALESERAHVIGHSMGGWLAIGMAKFFPSRLSSLVIGGWNLLGGVPATPSGPMTFERLMDFAKRTAPELVNWVTPAFEPGLRACFDALGQLAQAKDAVLNLPVPVMLWSGREDANCDPMQAFAAANGLRSLTTSGDHLGMIFRHASEAASGLLAFLDTRMPQAPNRA
ncbi:MAG: alpha/beta hydrolase [Pseudomonadota bacterium]